MNDRNALRISPCVREESGPPTVGWGQGASAPKNPPVDAFLPSAVTSGLRVMMLVLLETTQSSSAADNSRSTRKLASFAAMSSGA